MIHLFLPGKRAYFCNYWERLLQTDFRTIYRMYPESIPHLDRQKTKGLGWLHNSWGRALLFDD